MKTDLFEITTKARISPPITTVELAEAFLSPAELEACTTEQTRVTLKEKVVFTATKGLIEALYDIVKPEAINRGDIKILKHVYFRWSSARPRIMKQQGLTDVSYIGTRNRISGIRVSSQVSDDKSHRKKFVALIRQFKKNFPKHQVTWENCLHTIQCDVEDVKAFQKVLDEKNE